MPRLSVVLPVAVATVGKTDLSFSIISRNMLYPPRKFQADQFGNSRVEHIDSQSSTRRDSPGRSWFQILRQCEMVKHVRLAPNELVQATKVQVYVELIRSAIFQPQQVAFRELCSSG